MDFRFIDSAADLPQVNHCGACGNLRLVEREGAGRQGLVLVVGDADNVHRLVAHFKSCCPQQRGCFIKVEPQGLDGIFFGLGSEFDGVGLGGFGLGLFVFWVTLAIMGGGYDDDN